MSNIFQLSLKETNLEKMRENQRERDTLESFLNQEGQTLICFVSYESILLTP